MTRFNLLLLSLCTSFLFSNETETPDTLYLNNSSTENLISLIIQMGENKSPSLTLISSNSKKIYLLNRSEFSNSNEVEIDFSFSLNQSDLLDLEKILKAISYTSTDHLIITSHFYADQLPDLLSIRVIEILSRILPESSICHLNFTSIILLDDEDSLKSLETFSSVIYENNIKFTHKGLWEYYFKNNQKINDEYKIIYCF